MRALSIQISGIIGILTFLKYLLNNASVEKTIFTSLAVGFSIYIVLVMGDYAIHQILKYSAPPQPEDAKVKNETITTGRGNASSTKTAKA